MNKKSIGVLMGGVSSEHAVSLKTGQVMLESLDEDRYTGFPILISPENKWYWPKNILKKEEASLPSFFDLEKGLSEWYSCAFPYFEVFPRCDMMLNGLHGQGGEDGRLQGFFDLCHQKYTGSGYLSSAVAMDKIWSKSLLIANGVSTPKHLVFELKEGSSKNIPLELGYPLVVKDPCGGSSVGVYVVKDEQELENALSELKKNCTRVLCEAFIKGREATCGYINEWSPLPVTEIIPEKDTFFNYEAKYQVGRTKEVTPGDFSDELVKEMQRISQQCHEIHGLSVYSRTDFLVVENSLFVLEINTLPGFTHQSLLPQAAKITGLGFKELLSKIIEESEKK